MVEFGISVSVHGKVRKEGLVKSIKHHTVCTTLEGVFVIRYVTCRTRKSINIYRLNMLRTDYCAIIIMS